MAMGNWNLLSFFVLFYTSFEIFLIMSYFLADIRELISLEDVMEELGLGPNGGLMYCMEYPYNLLCAFFLFPLPLCYPARDASLNDVTFIKGFIISLLCLV